MGTFDYFCNPSILGRMQGQGSAVKDWRALPEGYPSIFGKNAGAGQCSKKLASATAGGLPRYLWQKCRGKAVQKKIGERYRWGLPLIFGKNAGARQCSKNWRALPLGGYPSIFGKNAGAGQCSKKLGARFWEMQGQGSAVKNWRALPLGATLYLWENARAGQCSKRLASAAGGLPHYLWEKCRGRAVQQKLASAAGGATPLSCRSRAMQ